MTMLSKDAKFFVEGVTKYLRSEKTSETVIPKVAAAFKKITAKARREESATVESATGLTAGEKHQTARLLARVLGRELRIEYRVNKGLIAGLKFVVGDWVVDTSVRSQLTTMQEMLT